MRKLFIVLVGILLALLLVWPARYNTPDLDQEVGNHVFHPETYDDFCLKIIRDTSLHTEGWDTLVQPNFWRKAMKMGPDSLIVNIAKTREILTHMKTSEWRGRSEKNQKAYEDSVRKVHGLRKKDEIYFTTGRNHFYKYEALMTHIDKAVGAFMKEETDPWYAQSILLIESPDRLQFSTDGAYGAFQLMEDVAREVGLVVNDSLDEREDFYKSAQGAARLIRRVCLPKTRELCKDYGLAYKETDLWFRLLVMHVYHAGNRNVRRVIRKIRPKEGGIGLIQKIWQTKARRFGNASQNYSQITLASMLEMDELIRRKGIICPEEHTAIP